MLRFLSNYLPRQTPNELYKLYLPPHLDNGDVIYHIPQKVCDFSHKVTLHRLMEQLESVQYSAGLAITGEWKVLQETKYAGNHGMTEGGAGVSFSSLSLSTNLHLNIQDILFYESVGQIMPLEIRL